MAKKEWSTNSDWNNAVGSDNIEIVNDKFKVKSITPDISMFDNPIYHFYAGVSGASYGTVADFPEELDSSVPDASAVNSPTLKEDFGSTGYDMFEYQPADADSHTVSPDAEYSNDNKLSVFALVYPNDISSTSGAGLLFDISTDASFGFYSSSYAFIHTGGGNSSLRGSPTANSLETVGVSYDNGSADIFGNGSLQKSFSTSITIDGNNVTISQTTESANYDGGIAEVIVCAGVESESNYSSYHSDRI